jgi:copper chaperone
MTTHQTRLEITGMTCDHCVRAVTEALQGVPGVTGVEVALKPGQAVVKGLVAADALVAAVMAEGYRAKPLASAAATEAS